MPNMTRETVQVSDRTWLGSSHGIYETPSGVVDVSTFTRSTHYPDGYLRSGLPVGRRASDGLFVLYNPAGSGGAQTLAGFLLTEQTVTGAVGERVNAPVLRHGFINVACLPVAGFSPPAGSSSFVFHGARAPVGGGSNGFATSSFSTSPFGGTP